jgi:hypothetical protein
MGLTGFTQAFTDQQQEIARHKAAACARMLLQEGRRDSGDSRQRLCEPTKGPQKGYNIESASSTSDG